MGKSLPTPTSLRLSNSDHSYKLQLGKSDAVEFDGLIRENDDGEHNEIWGVTYSEGDRFCSFYLCRKKGTNNSRLLEIKIHECGESSPFCSQANVIVERAEAGLHDGKNIRIISFPTKGIANILDSKCNLTDTFSASKTTNARGVVTDTIFLYFGSETRIRLIVFEWKRKRLGEEPYVATVAHYYVNKENGDDEDGGGGVGLSVAVKNIRVSNDGNLDFAVDGPEKHPASALLYMIDQVRRTKTWDPSYCPHCAINIIHMQRAGIYLSETEDSSDLDSAPPPPLQRRWPIAPSLVSNAGRFRGNNNGNTFINTLYGRYR